MSNVNTVDAEPNQMSEIYRNHQPASIPLQLEKHLQFLEFSEDGHMLCGSGNLCGRYWNGSLWYSREAITSVNVKDYVTGIDAETAPCDAKFLESHEKVVLGEDSGAISILELTEMEGDGSLRYVPQVAAYDHDSATLTLSVSEDKQRLVSGSMDTCIKVWDIADGLLTLHTFRPAHMQIVSHVEYSPSSNDVFASCSLDGCALLWDTRQARPATVLKSENEEGLTSGSWKKDDDTIFAVGSIFGNLSLIDVRKKGVIAEMECFNRPLYKLRYNREGILAACGDTHEIKVLKQKSESFDVVYISETHEDFVRGLAWHPTTKKLYSCGFDSKIIVHTVNEDR